MTGVSWARLSAVVFAIMFLFPPLGIRNSGAQGEWELFLVDNCESPLTGYGTTSIAVDSIGDVHVGYRMFDNSSPSPQFLLKHASKSGLIWDVSTVDLAGNAIAGLPTSIALNSSDGIHIGYSNVTSGVSKVMYARNDSSSWVLTELSSGNGIGGLCLDSEDRVHYCYALRIGLVNCLTYSTNRSGSWSEETVDDANNSMDASIVVDSNNHVHIAYEVALPFSLHYATNSSGSWTTQMIDDSGRRGHVAVDSTGVPYVAYTVENGSSWDLKLSWLSGGLWLNTTVDTADSVGILPSIAIDSTDGIHLSYVIHSGTDSATLMYSHRSATDWTKSVVEQFVAAQAYIVGTSLAVDLTGDVHIVYMRGQASSYDSGGGLRYATNSSSEIPEMSVFVVLACMLVMTSIISRYRKHTFR